MRAPVLILPENIFFENSPYLKLDTGQIEISSDLRKFNKQTNYNEIEDDKQLYDNYTVELRNISLSMNYPNST